jgi:hypothetical protein
VSAPLTGDEAHIQVLKGADPARLAAILREEPAMVVAQLLELAEWPWRRAVLTRLGAMVRAQVEDAQLERTPPPGKRLRAQLLEAVVRRLAEPASSPSSARPWLRWRGGGRR